MKKIIKTSLVPILFWTLPLGSIYGQIRSAFILAENGSQPRIAIDRLSNLHATWLNRGEGDDVAYGLFDSLGYPKRVPQQFGGGFFTFNPRIAVGEVYGVVVYDVGHPATEIGFGGTLFTIDGEPVPGLADVLDDLGTNAFHPDVTFVTDSTFFVVWADDALKAGAKGYDIFGQMLTTSLHLIGTTQILSDGDSENLNPFIPPSIPRVATHPNSENMIVAWWEEISSTEDRIFGRMVSKSGAPLDSTFLISAMPDTLEAFAPALAITAEGEFLVVWSAGKGVTAWDIYLRRFRADGMVIGESQKINTAPAIGSAPVEISLDADGRCIVVWEGGITSDSKIFGQRFEQDGTFIGENFRIAAATDTLEQFWPSVALRNGKIYTTWTTFEGSSIFSIWANILDFDNPIVRVEDQLEPVPTRFQLFQNYPNPFNPTTAIRYEVQRRSHVRLVIYNVLGEEIVTLKSKEVMPGSHEEKWDGKDAKGLNVPSGVYLYRLITGGFSQGKKMTLVR